MTVRGVAGGRGGGCGRGGGAGARAAERGGAQGGRGAGQTLHGAPAAGYCRRAVGAALAPH